ncbi:LysR family transcriptional regulator [Termitidicoccus mucosus]|uniref:HTH lysR-type domain-containing protein n=1 Tax=Termitidicoccus mucosus TaxID=1184151 RepID=A0A178IJ43_9BACT|nr:hypothetical protein AW736_11400 [Opitutaceae bacterium TSB47]
MEIHQLRYLVAVVETGNFTRAAERHRHPPADQPALAQPADASANSASPNNNGRRRPNQKLRCSSQGLC